MPLLEYADVEELQLLVNEAAIQIDGLQLSVSPTRLRRHARQENRLYV